MITPVLNSYLMEVRYQSFVGMIVTCQIVCFASFFVIWISGQKLSANEAKQQKEDNRTEKPLLA